MIPIYDILERQTYRDTKKKKKRKSVVVRGLGSGGDWKEKVKLLEHRVYLGL